MAKGSSKKMGSASKMAKVPTMGKASKKSAKVRGVEVEHDDEDAELVEEKETGGSNDEADEAENEERDDQSDTARPAKSGAGMGSAIAKILGNPSVTARDPVLAKRKTPLMRTPGVARTRFNTVRSFRRKETDVNK